MGVSLPCNHSDSGAELGYIYSMVTAPARYAIYCMTHSTAVSKTLDLDLATQTTQPPVGTACMVLVRYATPSAIRGSDARMLLVRLD